jgi:type 1 glutamine amidotransferase
MGKSIILIIAFFLNITLYAQTQKKVLIYTKNGKGYVHDNIAASVAALKKICDEQKWVYKISDDPTVFTSENLQTFDALIFSNTNNEIFDIEDQRNAFQKYIQKGGGFVGIHSSTGSERNWPWFWAMEGGKFLRHPPLQAFDIKRIDSTNLSTRHLPAIWKWEDECYFINNLNPDIHILLAVDLNTVTDDKMAEYPGEVFGTMFPLAWCHRFDGGWEWYTALGHKPEHYKDKNFIEHLKGGILWVLAKK